jgi:diguanylate cyclase (GGDEF)-like protein
MRYNGVQSPNRRNEPKPPERAGRCPRQNEEKVRPKDETTRIIPGKIATTSASLSHECLVEIYGENLGKRYVLSHSPLHIGRGLDSDIPIGSDAVSRRHAEVQRRESGWVVIDLESTNGTWVNERSVTEALLNAGDHIQIGDTIFKYLAGNHIEGLYFEEIYRMMIYDGLTGVYNRRYLNDFLEREFSRARRHGRDLSVVFVDLDNFKDINDNFGHLAGDHVLKRVARAFGDRIRREEIVGRYGGDEFLVVIPESNLKDIVQFAEIIKSRIETQDIEFDNERIHVTVSVGIAVLAEGMERYEDLLARADKRLYDAKRAGKNRVVV